MTGIQEDIKKFMSRLEKYAKRQASAAQVPFVQGAVGVLDSANNLLQQSKAIDHLISSQPRGIKRNARELLAEEGEDEQVDPVPRRKVKCSEASGQQKAGAETSDHQVISASTPQDHGASQQPPAAGSLDVEERQIDPV